MLTSRNQGAVMFKRIVVALDGSHLSEQSLPHAVALAQAFGADLVLLRVIEQAPSETTGHHLPDPLEWEAWRAEAPAYLNDVADKLRAQGVSAEIVTVEGEPTDQIISYVRSEPKTLLAICSHGRSGLTGWALGSVVQKTIFHAHVSLLVVRAFQDSHFEPGALVYRKMMVCLDGSKRAECVLPTVSALAKNHAVRACLATVVEDWVSRYRLADSDPRLSTLKELDDQRRQASKHYGEATQQHFQNRDMDATYRQEYDVRPLHTLHDIAADEHADLVVMAAHGQSCTRKWPFGSVALNFLIYAEAPLLVVQDLTPEDIEPTCAEATAREIRGH